MGLRKWLRLPDKTKFVISTDTDGLTVTRQAEFVLERRVVRWDEVNLVVGYLKDCLSIDQIRLEFSLVGGDSLLLTEDYVGFAALSESLAEYLPGMPEDWHHRLAASPAFDPTIHTFFKRMP